MKLKVKVRKEDSQSLIPALIVTFIFGTMGIISLVNIVVFFLNFNLEYFIEVFSSSGMGLLIFFGLGMIGIYLVYFLFKFPTEVIGVLKGKENIAYKGKNIWKMDFIIYGEDKSSITLSCYTEEENGLEVGSKYVVLLKEFNWKIKCIGEIDNEKKYGLIKTPTMKPVFYLFFFIFGFGIAFLLFKMIYDFEKRNNYLINLIPLVICGVIFYCLFKSYKTSYIDSDNVKTDTEQDEDNDS